MPAPLVDPELNVESFADRARVLVAFLVERGREAGSSARHHEQALEHWIAQWQQAMPEAQHFMAVELGIILRALNGPVAGRRSLDNDCQRVSWVLARRMSDQTV